MNELFFSLATRLFGAAPSTAAFLFLAPAMWLTEDQQPKFLCQVIHTRVSPHTIQLPDSGYKSILYNQIVLGRSDASFLGAVNREIDECGGTQQSR
jgi:hypothetical protein